MLIVGIEQQRELCMKKQYREAGELIRETGSLLGFFFPKDKSQDDYSDIEELRMLKDEWDHLCNQLRIQILEEFELVERGIVQVDLLREATHAVDAMGMSAVHEVKMQFASFVLRPYADIFEPGKPDGEFERASRRFSWLKRTLKDF
jgi:hypothetical protein